MLLWGGTSSANAPGGRYNPTSDTWTTILTNNAPYANRTDFTAIWTGTEMIIWGGYSGGALTLGGRFNPTSGTWTNVTGVGGPTARFDHTAVWTGTEMIIYGGNGTSAGVPAVAIRRRRIHGSICPVAAVTGHNIRRSGPAQR